MAAVPEVADVFRRHGEAFRQARAGHLGRVEQCDDCGATRIAYNSLYGDLFVKLSASSFLNP